MTIFDFSSIKVSKLVKKKSEVSQKTVSRSEIPQFSWGWSVLSVSCAALVFFLSRWSAGAQTVVCVSFLHLLVTDEPVAYVDPPAIFH